MPSASILVVEDERIIAKGPEQQLMSLGYEVSGLAGDANEALRMVTEVSTDLVLMDINLGSGMDGVNAARLMRAECDVPIVFLTAHSDPATLQRAKTTDPFGFIVKPFTEPDLQTAIELALYRHGVDMRVREKEQWLSATLGSIGDGVIATDTNGRILFLNTIAEAVTGYCRAELLGKNFDTTFPLVSVVTQAVVPNVALEALSRDAVVPLRGMSFLRADGCEPVHLEGAAAPIRDAYGHVSGAVVAFRDVSSQRRLEHERDNYRKELENANKQLRLQASTDQLTGLKNRRAFQDGLWRELSRLKRVDGALSLMMLDVDRFKQFNDTFGHPAGDVVLKEVARILQESARSIDTVARYGGEEFVAVLPDTDEPSAIVVAERMRQLVASADWPHRGVTISIGVASCDASGPTDGAGLIARADKALYTSKANGRNRVTHANQLTVAGMPVLEAAVEAR